MCAAETIIIDGSEGEGGGQILRTSMAFAAVCRVPVRIENIRGKRPRPGLARQHLTAMKAIARVTNGQMSGDELGSRRLEFVPQEIVGGHHEFRIGTAGSATLVLQTILPALLVADQKSTVVLEGGTHNQWAPPVDFLEHAFLPLLCKMGAEVRCRLIRYGFHPAGGGRLEVEITPTRVLRGFDLQERGDLCRRHSRVLISNLPGNIAEREQHRLVRKLRWKDSEVTIDPVPSSGPGNVIVVKLQFEHVTEVFTAFGRLGTSAEHVADEVVKDVTSYLGSTAPVGEYLADQLLLPLALSAAGEGSHRGGSFRTTPLSQHSKTQMDIIRRFLPVEFEVRSTDEDCTVHVRPASGSTS
ncbi:MAG: RNA 3'-terminal phosphate cyclase [Planctomyces sp.]|nr:RNA 3'-terminal phosphate cyclase [Planctomyces sp.]